MADPEAAASSDADLSTTASGYTSWDEEANPLLLCTPEERPLTDPFAHTPRVPSVFFADDPAGELVQREYVARHLPVVVRGAAPCLPMHLGEPSFWYDHFGSLVVPLNIGDRSAELEMPLAWFMDAAKVQVDNTGYYMRNLHLMQYFPQLVPDVRCPPSVLGANFLSTGSPVGQASIPAGLPAAWHDWCEVFITGRGSGVYTHSDVMATHAWSAQLCGVKRFYLAAPSEAPHLYPMAAAPRISRIRELDFADAAAFPDFAKATVHSVELQPGDIAYIPPDWWHSTRVVSSGINITLGGNFVNASNLSAFLAELARSSSPPGSGRCGGAP